MNKDLLDDPDEFWKSSLSQYRKIIGKPEALDPVENLKQIDREGIITNSIACVNQVVDHLASAISPIGSQAQVVLGALQYLAGTIQFHKQNYNVKGVLDQMREASGALDRVDGYIKAREGLATIDEPLRRIITNYMAVYLQLCLIYAKVKKNSKTASGRTKNLLKTMIGWDGGIGHCIEELDKLTQQEVVQNVAAMRISDLSKTERWSKKEDSLKLRSLLQVEETGEHWSERQRRLEQESLPGIGDWLFDETGKFEEWTNNVQQRPDNAILWLTGPAIYGKSHICCRAIKYLRKEIETGNLSRHCQTSVAWFYHQEKRPLQSKPLSEFRRTRDKKGAEGKKGTSNAAKKEVPELREILMTLIWQLAESDRSFQKHVIEQFRRSPRAFAKPSQIWSDLIEAFCLQPRSGNSRPHCFFLIIDGDDESNNGDTKSLSQTMQEFADSFSRNVGKKRPYCHIRLMIARTEVTPPKAREIKVPQDSRDSDVKIFIEHHLKNFLEWSKGNDNHRLVCSLERRLISMFSKGETVKGEAVNYHVLAGLLEEISRIGVNLEKLREFEKILNPDKTNKVLSSVIIPSQLRRLDEELEDEDKKILNDMISLLVCSKDWPTIKQLSAFLSLSQGSSFTKSIKDEIHEKYSHIMKISYHGYVQSYPLLSFFDDMPDAQPWSVPVDKSQKEKINLLIFHLVTCENSTGHSVQGWSVFEMPHLRLVAASQVSILSALPSTMTYPATILSLSRRFIFGTFMNLCSLRHTLCSSDPSRSFL